MLVSVIKYNRYMILYFFGFGCIFISLSLDVRRKDQTFPGDLSILACVCVIVSMKHVAFVAVYGYFRFLLLISNP